MLAHGIWCLGCKVERSCKSWTPAQWKRKTAKRETVEGKPAFIGCRECHSTAPRVRAPTPERWSLPNVQGRSGLKVSTISAALNRDVGIDQNMVHASGEHGGVRVLHGHRDRPCPALFRLQAASSSVIHACPSGNRRPGARQRR